MPSIVFEKGIVTDTFFVTFEGMSLEELQRPAAISEAVQELDSLWLDLESTAAMPEVPAVHDDPQFWARVTVDKLFHSIIVRTRPQGVVMKSHFLYKEADAPHVAALRQKIESGETAGQILTICLEFTRPDLTRPYLTKPEPLPFPGLSWLTSQAREELCEGLTVLHTTASQIPG